MTNKQRLLATDVGLRDLTGDQLRARVARAQLYLIHMRPIPDATDAPSPSLMRDHLAYLYRLELEGRLYGSGPLGTTAGPLPHELAIVAARSRDEANEIATNEPLNKAGLRRSTVQPHTMNEGVACYFGRALSKRAEAQTRSFDPDISAITLTYEQLSSRAAGIQLYLVDLEPTDTPRPSDDAQTGYDHFIWLRDHEMQAKLMSCGPIEPSEPLAPGIWGGGLGIVATSQAEADRIADIEPSGKAGYRTVSARPWTMDYGLAVPIAQGLTTLNSLPA